MFLELSGFPLVLLAIIAFIVILGLIICLHEAGHFYMAKKFDVLCHDYSIGMGPAIYKKKGKETTFCVRAIPIGGFVSMAGEEATDDFTKVGTKVGLNLEDDIVTEIILDDAKDCMVRGEINDKDLDGKDGKDLYITLMDDMGETHYYQVSETATYVFEKNETLQLAPYHRTFDAKKIWQRLLILFAGPFMNFVLAFVLYLIIAFATGVPNYDSNRVGTVSSGYPAASFLAPGDYITSVNGVSTKSWTDFQREMDKIYDNYGTTVNITYSHDNEEHTATMETYTSIVSIGLTNFGAKDFQLVKIPGTDVFGLEVGKTTLSNGKNSIRYKAEEGTLSKGDYITKVSIDGTEYTIESWSQIIKLFKEMNVTTSVDVRFEYYDLKDEGTYSLVKLEDCKSIEPYTDELLSNQRIEKIAQYIGVAPGYHFSFFECIGEAAKGFWNDFTLIFRTLGILIAPSSVRQVGVSDLSSVVGIFDMVKQYIGAGFIPLLSLTALLSVNIGVMNLLPIPALDGGRIVFIIIEGITGKKVPKKVESIINLVFMGLLLILFVFITYNDILRLIH